MEHVNWYLPHLPYCLFFWPYLLSIRLLKVKNTEVVDSSCYVSNLIKNMMSCLLLIFTQLYFMSQSANHLCLLYIGSKSWPFPSMGDTDRAKEPCRPILISYSRALLPYGLCQHSTSTIASLTAQTWSTSTCWRMGRLLNW